MRLSKRVAVGPVVCVAAALVAALPVWLVTFLPVQDLPIHLAAIRVIHSLHDLTYGFESDYALTLGKTQYLLYYLAGSALAYPLGVRSANLALVTFYLAGTVLATGSLARALDKDERVALFAVPFLYNCSFVIGFLPFLLGIPILLVCLAQTVRYLRAPTRLRGAVLAVLGVLLFYAHIAPFTFYVIGYGLLFLLRRARRWIVDLLPIAPVMALFAFWLFFTEAGRVTRSVASTPGADAPWPYDQAIAQVYDLAFNVFRDTTDETLFLAAVALAIFAAGAAQGDRDRARPAARVLAALPILAMVFFLRSSHRNGYVAHIRDRFPILFVFTLIPLLRFPRGARGALATALLSALTLAVAVNVKDHFAAFDEEAAGFRDAIAKMAPRRYVAAFAYDPSSQVTTQNPFLHFGQYYQVEKGGIVQFSFAGYPHWPYTFREGRQVPPGEPVGEGWCWSPQAVPVMGTIYPYFDYVLTRGDGFHPPPHTYRRIFGSGRWVVWQRESAPSAP